VFSLSQTIFRLLPNIIITSQVKHLKSIIQKRPMSDQPQQKPNLPPPYYFEEDTISLSDILLMLAGQIKVILITPTILCIIIIIYAFFFTSPVYDSTAKIMSSSGRASQAAGGLAARFGLTLPTNQSEPQWVYPEIIKSRTLARAMLQRKFNTKKFGHQKSLLQILTYGNEEPEIDLNILIKNGVESVINMIDIQKNGPFYDLTVSSSDPLFSRDFAVVLIEELDTHQREYNKVKTIETRMFIEERISDTRFELESAEEALKDFNDRNRRIENSPALQLRRQRLAREVAVLTGVFTTLKQQLETAKIEEVKKRDYVIVLDPPEAPLVRSRPNKKLMVILAGFLGIGLGVIIGLVREYAQNRDEEEQEKMGQAKSLIIKNIMDFIPNRLIKK
jgi:capsule polysaccharide export protein KpsE/RkpR